MIDAGSVRLMNGATGAQIGPTLVGDSAAERLGSGCAFSRSGVTALANGNYVVASPQSDEGGLVDAGSVRLIDGNNGQQIGAALVGDEASDFLGSGGVTALPNGNFVIASPLDDNGGLAEAGSVRLIDGETGAQIGNAVTGAVVTGSAPGVSRRALQETLRSPPRSRTWMAKWTGDRFSCSTAPPVSPWGARWRATLPAIDSDETG